jgi:hypothetical protein
MNCETYPNRHAHTSGCDRLDGRANMRRASRVRLCVWVARCANVATQKGTTWLVFSGRHCSMADLDGAAMVGGKTRQSSRAHRVPTRERSLDSRPIFLPRPPAIKGAAHGLAELIATSVPLSPYTFSGALSSSITMPRSLQITWAKLFLAARARFPRTLEEERAARRAMGHGR